MLIPIRNVNYYGDMTYQKFTFDVKSTVMHRAKLVSKEWYDLLSYLSDDVLLDETVACTFDLSLPLDIHQHGNIPRKVVGMAEIFIDQDYPNPNVCDQDDIALIKLIRYCASHTIRPYTSFSMNDMEMFHESLKYT